MTIKNVGIVANPWSGRGIGTKLSGALCDALCAEGFAVTARPSAASYEPAEICDFFTSQDAVVVIGGDGTIGKLLPVAATTARPLCMLPAGNESLFARAFSMRHDHQAIVRSLRRGQTELHHFGFAGDVPFFLMASVGFDADVVAALSKVRKGPVGNRGYVLPSWRTFVRYAAPHLTIVVDGTTVVHDEPGYFIVANSAQYARGLNPVPDARSDYPRLRARFFPNFTRRSIARAVIAAGLKRPLTHGSRSFEGSHFEIVSRQPAEVQVDGDHGGCTPIEVRRAAAMVPILLP